MLEQLLHQNIKANVVWQQLKNNQDLKIFDKERMLWTLKQNDAAFDEEFIIFLRN